MKKLISKNLGVIKQDALALLVAGAPYGISSFDSEGGFGYSDIDFQDTTPFTEEEFNTEVARLQAEYDNAQYARDRAAAYPSIEDQLDKIYHGGINAWKADIKAVKDANPKP